MKDFRAISVSSSPYICAQCQREVYLKTINEMKDTIAALKTEISELRAAPSEVSNKREQADEDNRGINNQWSDVVRRTIKQARVNRSQQQGVGGVAREQKAPHQNPHQQSMSGTKRQPRRARTQREQEKYGAHTRAPTTGEVKGAISMLVSTAADDLAIKRKFKTLLHVMTDLLVSELANGGLF